MRLLTLRDVFSAEIYAELVVRTRRIEAAPPIDVTFLLQKRLNEILEGKKQPIPKEILSDEQLNQYVWGNGFISWETLIRFKTIEVRENATTEEVFKACQEEISNEEHNNAKAE